MNGPRGDQTELKSDRERQRLHMVTCGIQKPRIFDELIYRIDRDPQTEAETKLTVRGGETN